MGTNQPTYNILYVDDEHDNLTAFKAVFRRHYQIFLAESGAEAIQILEREKIDLIISDQRMPKMTGVQLFEKIKDLYPDILRIVLTGYSDLQAIIDAINKGKVWHYISKPWDVNELKLIMDKALETYTLRLKTKALEKEKNELLLKNAQQEKEQILAQFEILKNQINPHFLFNSMNILAALIPKNPEKAISFSNSFSRLYRKLLQLREQLIISISEELEFVIDYLALQKMRFDESLEFDISISEEVKNCCLPPFALQILVENAIKHNIVSEDNPLKISIFDQEEKIHVVNNLQKRGTPTESSGIGLSNLKARYELIGTERIQIVEENGFFSAIIPVILNG